MRERLDKELAALGPAVLHARLAAADPAAATAILPSNGRRIVRALEVIELSGRPFSATLPDYRSVLPAVQIGLALPRPNSTSGSRPGSAQMWQAGFVDEVRRLAGQGEPGTGLRAGRTASRALGYAQVLRFLDGEWTEAEAERETVRWTRRFARRQESWFRRDPRIRWLPAGQPVPTRLALAVIDESAAAAD